jgi:DNA-binding CsgD family transcriptional regulator/PAS domain-containing protein
VLSHQLGEERRRERLSTCERLLHGFEVALVSCRRDPEQNAGWAAGHLGEGMGDLARDVDEGAWLGGHHLLTCAEGQAPCDQVERFVELGMGMERESVHAARNLHLDHGQIPAGLLGAQADGDGAARGREDVRLVRWLKNCGFGVGHGINVLASRCCCPSPRLGDLRYARPHARLFSVTSVASRQRTFVHSIEARCAAGGEAEELLESLVDELWMRMDLVGACWHRTDPATGVPVASGRRGSPPGDFRRSLHYEFEREDYNRFAELADSRPPVASLSAATGGKLERSPRYREMIAPGGAADEARAAFGDAFGVWGALTLFSAAIVQQEHVELIAAIAPAITTALRRAAQRRARFEDGLAGVAVLDAQDRIIYSNDRVREMLGTPDTFPGIVYVLATHARAGRSTSAPAIDRAGRWLSVASSPLEGREPGTVMVLVQSCADEGPLEVTLRAYGLSSREREVVTLAVRGRSAKQIAERLYLSPLTVEDHLRSAYRKTGTSGRAALAELAYG